MRCSCIDPYKMTCFTWDHRRPACLRAGRPHVGPAIQIQGLTKQRGSKVVFSGVTLELSDGEILGLVGANGAGKTTLIKCLLDLDTPDSGKITIFGRQHDRASAREALAYLPENFRPPAHLKGKEFLDYMCRLHGNVPDPKRTGEILEILDMEPDELEQRTLRLSNGAAQKLGLAACLLSGKKLLILDEPMNGLDPKARASLREHLLKLKKLGHSCLLTSHLLSDAEKLCGNIAILHRGNIRYIGTPAECCRHFNAVDLEQAFLRCAEGDR